MDAVYGKKEDWLAIKARFPEAVYEDARTEFRPDRFTVELPTPDKGLSDEYLKFMIESGLAGLSFGIQLMMHEEEGRAKLKAILVELGKVPPDAKN